jgi:hypothetical protein
VYKNAKVQGGTMKKKKQKIIIYHEMFIPWIFEDYDQSDMFDAWAAGEDMLDFAIGIAGLIPIQHIKNWDDIKGEFNTEPYVNFHSDLDPKYGNFNSWSEYYEDDGYIEGFGAIPDTLEVEWDYTPLEDIPYK